MLVNDYPSARSGGIVDLEALGMHRGAIASLKPGAYAHEATWRSCPQIDITPVFRGRTRSWSGFAGVGREHPLPSHGK